jgi:hypothetical protein
MKLISIRNLRNRSRRALAELERLIRRARAQRAVSRIRKQARASGLDRLSPDEIEGEIQAARAHASLARVDALQRETRMRPLTDELLAQAKREGRP